MRCAVLTATFLLGLAVQVNAQPNPAPAGEGAPVTRAEIRELIEAAQATAKASRENVDYSRVVPDLLYQILAKLDKIEDKLDKVENAVKSGRTSQTRR
jgi:hypothetical protein